MKKNTNTIELLLKKSFIGMTCAFFAVSLGLQAYYAMQQFPYNSNLSAIYYAGFSGLLLPAVLLVAGWLLLAKSYASRLDRLFWAMVIATVAYTIFSIVQMVLFAIIYQLPIMHDSGWSREYITLGGSLIPVVVYFLLMYFSIRRVRK